MRHLGEVMTVQNEPSAKTHGVILTEAAAAKAKSLLDQEDGTIWRCGSRFSRGVRWIAL